MTHADLEGIMANAKDMLKEFNRVKVKLDDFKRQKDSSMEYVNQIAQ